MPCSFCKQGNHTEPNCPFVHYREHYVYHMFCLLRYDFYRNQGYRFSYIYMDLFLKNILKSFSSEAFHSLYNYVENTYPTNVDMAAQALEINRWNIGRQNMLRILCHLGCQNNTIYVGVSNYSALENAIRSNTLPQVVTARLWRSENTRVQYYSCIRYTTFGPMPHRPYSSEHLMYYKELAAPSKINVVIDDTLKIPDNNEDNCCPVCMESYKLENIGKLNCGHHICTGCLKECEKHTRTSQDVTCCLCRASVHSISVTLENSTYGTVTSANPDAIKTTKNIFGVVTMFTASLNA